MQEKDDKILPIIHDKENDINTSIISPTKLESKFKNNRSDQKINKSPPKLKDLLEPQKNLPIEQSYRSKSLKYFSRKRVSNLQLAKYPLLAH